MVLPREATRDTTRSTLTAQLPLGGDTPTTSRQSLSGDTLGQTQLRSPPSRPPEPAPNLIRAHPSGFGVRTQVIDAKGRPVNDAWVQLVSRSDTSSRFDGPSAAVNEDGWFDLTLPDARLIGDLGGLELLVHATGHATWRARVVDTGGEDVVRLPAPTGVTLQLRFDDGRPAVGAVVTTMTSSMPGLTEAPWVPRQPWAYKTPRVVADEFGRVLLPHAGVALELQLEIEHPEHSSHPTLVIGPDTEVRELMLERTPVLEIDLGPYGADWKARNMLPNLRLNRAGMETYQTPKWIAPPGLDRPADRAWFYPVYPYTQRLLLGDRVVAHEITPRPGLHVLRVVLPAPPEQAPSEHWMLTVEVVDPQGHPAAERGLPWGDLPNVLLEDADGRTTYLDAAVAHAGKVVNLRPPVRASFAQHIGGPRADGITPLQHGRLLVDLAAWRARTASVRADVSAIDPVQRHLAVVQLVPQQSSNDSGRIAWPISQRGRIAWPISQQGESPQLYRGLTPGMYRWAIIGRGVLERSGLIELKAGDETTLVAEPDPRAQQRTPPDSPFGLVRAQVSLRSDDPWVELDEVHFESLDATSRSRVWPLAIVDGHARGGVPPGRYRLRATARRVAMPEVLLAAFPGGTWSAAVSTRETAGAAHDAANALASPAYLAALAEHEQRPVPAFSTSVELSITEGGAHDVALQVDASGLGLLFIEGAPDAAHRPLILGEDQPELRVVVTNTDGKQLFEHSFTGFPPGGVSLALPPGLYHLEARDSSSDVTSEPRRISVKVPSSRDGEAAVVDLDAPLAPVR
ncbi:MAG: hypothetical protein DRQ55_16765 [Planctomycetota bacterium]|nr:MAG: hypothetical protein DRQ55_16765 [Planctomycetota bacterium]